LFSVLALASKSAKGVSDVRTWTKALNEQGTQHFKGLLMEVAKRAKEQAEAKKQEREELSKRW